MSYFDPKIYNKQNLNDKDKDELEYWQGIINDVIKSCRDDTLSDGTGSDTLDKIITEIVDTFCDNLRADFGFALQEMVVSIIDNYEHEVEPQDNPETYIIGE